LLLAKPGYEQCFQLKLLLEKLPLIMYSLTASRSISLKGRISGLEKLSNAFKHIPHQFLLEGTLGLEAETNQFLAGMGRGTPKG
jgi:hypothetical protein